jgi:ribosomal protein S18 acetylase RimI-like enzyme
MAIEETSDRELLRALLHRDRAGTFYMAADLQPPFSEQCRWLVEAEKGEATAAVLIFSGLEPPSVLATGDPAAVGGILDCYGKELPPRFYTKLVPEQRRAFRGIRFSEAEELLVMVAPEEATIVAPQGADVRLISPQHPIEPVLKVYRDYPGNFFAPAHLKTGLYAGAWVDGELVAIAGTHAFAPDEGVAALGNIVTAAQFRGRGLCHAVTSFLCRELRKRGCRFLGLHVASGNTAAIACYRRCGFQAAGFVYQMLAEAQQNE